MTRKKMSKSQLHGFASENKTNFTKQQEKKKKNQYFLHIQLGFDALFSELLWKT